MGECIEVQASESVQTIMLDEITSGATMRYIIMEGKQYLSVRDLIMHLCNKNQNDGGEVWRNLSSDKKKEVQEFVLHVQFPGRGQTPQPVITFPGAIKLAMFLPGECAKKNRSIMASIIVRYYAGDPSLIREIEANAMSDASIPNMAREAMLCDGNSSKEECSLKRKREELELLKFETELTVKIAQAYTEICSNSAMDEHAKTVFKEAMHRTVQGKCNDTGNKPHSTNETIEKAPTVPLPIFAYVESARWPHGNPLVDKYCSLDDMEADNDYVVPSKMYTDKELNRNFKLPAGDSKYSILGFQYDGPRIVSRILGLGKQVKEAYGIKRDGKQFLILVLCHEVKPSRAWVVLYRLGLLSRFYLVQAISLYEMRKGPVLDDFILDTIKQPASDKWCWFLH
jgi:hypothetical protein